MNLTRLRRRRRRFAFYSLTRAGSIQIVFDRPPRRGLAPRREGDPDRVAHRGLRRVRPHPAASTSRDLTRRIDWRVGIEMVHLRLARDHRRARVLLPEPARPLHRQALPRPRRRGPLRGGVPLQPGRGRGRARLPDGLDALALSVASQRPSSGDGGARRELLLPRAPASSRCSSRPGFSPSSICSCPSATGTRRARSPRWRWPRWRSAPTPSSPSGST